MTEYDIAFVILSDFQKSVDQSQRLSFEPRREAISSKWAVVAQKGGSGDVSRADLATRRAARSPRSSRSTKNAFERAFPSVAGYRGRLSVDGGGQPPGP
ncbi:hypothetical protein K0M31_003649 [Melipona bicolor]|uniref:Uncharacterized protein n=1 Tax=Melipona bicolor TaxID=60889 RepID=A0AA40FZC9_9HYME|nr:hypothetical protein K0M31_003649 [Melipona bicolor]